MELKSVYEYKRVKECLPERSVIFLSAFFEGILLIPTCPERKGYGVKECL
jgi:hypothetical protein